MGEQPVDEKKLTDLVEVYGMLRRDAKDMLQDLLDGVSLWRSTARILFGFALLSFALVPLFTWGSATTSGQGNLGLSLSTGLGLIAVFLFGLGLVTSFTGVCYRRKYVQLRKKYSELYETAKKLS